MTLEKKIQAAAAMRKPRPAYNKKAEGHAAPPKRTRYNDRMGVR